jgi:hypothetical protein
VASCCGFFHPGPSFRDPFGPASQEKNIRTVLNNVMEVCRMQDVVEPSSLVSRARR